MSRNPRLLAVLQEDSGNFVVVQFLTLKQLFGKAIKYLALRGQYVLYFSDSLAHNDLRGGVQPLFESLRELLRLSRTSGGYLIEIADQAVAAHSQRPDHV